MKKINIGLIGAGGIGKIHIENIVRNMPQIDLKYIAEPFNEKYNQWALEKGLPEAIKDYRVILKDDSIEAVIICAPAALHTELIIESAECGKHIFCEKPFDYDLDKIQKAITSVEKAGVKLQIGFNRRFDKNFLKMKEHITSGNVGDIHTIKITSRDPVPPGEEYFTAEGGEQCSIFTDTSIHDFDMARYLNSSEVVSVFARGVKLINKDNPHIQKADTMAAILTFEDDSIAIIDNSWEAVYGYDQRAEVFGSKGTAIMNNEIFNNTVLLSDKGQIGELPLVTWQDRYGESYKREILEFIEAIQNNLDVKVTPEDGYLSMIIAKAAMLSAEENRVVMIKELM